MNIDRTLATEVLMQKFCCHVKVLNLERNQVGLIWQNISLTVKLFRNILRKLPFCFGAERQHYLHG